VAGRHTIICLEHGRILGQYMNGKHNLLYKTWTARPRRRRRWWWWWLL